MDTLLNHWYLLCNVTISIIFTRFPGIGCAIKGDGGAGISKLTSNPPLALLTSTTDKEYLSTQTDLQNETVAQVYDFNDLKERCPLADICVSQEGYNRTHSKESCCLPCRCDSVCKSIGNCCEKGDTEDYMCHRPYVGNGTNIHKYFMVDKCLNGSETDSCTNKNVAPWGSMYPVYDPSTDLNYYNDYCAKCNDVHSYTYWDLRLESQKFGWSMTHCLDVILGSERNKCALRFTPPKGVDILKHVCRDNIISSCNVTGRWIVYDAGLVNACQRWYSPLLDMVGTFRFANIYCIMCNSGGVPKFCTALPPDKDLTHTLSMVMDYRQVQNVVAQPLTNRIEDIKNERCGEFMVRHPDKVNIRQMSI